MWEEFLDRIGQTIYLSATPDLRARKVQGDTVEQIIRPDRAGRPEVVVKPTKGRSTTSSRDPSGSRRTSGSWSPR